MTSKKAGEATRNKLRNAGVDEAIWGSPTLTMDEANAALQALEDANDLKNLRELFREAGHPLADSPELTIEEARRLEDDVRAQVVVARCGPPLVDNPAHPGKYVVMYSLDRTKIVGEFAYRNEIAQAFSMLPSRPNFAYGWAYLMPDLTGVGNDEQRRVEIWVRNLKIGHLSDKDEAEVYDQLSDLKEIDGVFVMVPVVIQSGSFGFSAQLLWDTKCVPELRSDSDVRCIKEDSEFPSPDHPPYDDSSENVRFLFYLTITFAAVCVALIVIKWVLLP